VLIESEMREILSRFTYKPGFVFHVRAGIPNPEFHMDMAVRNSRAGDEVKITFWMPILPMASEEHFKTWVRRVVAGWELHETDEWLRFDGEMINNPHDPDVNFHFDDLFLPGVREGWGSC
jgi:hypothetical protein